MPRPPAVCRERVRAVVHDRYGPPEVLHLEEVPRPEPQHDEIVVRVRATTVNRTDCAFRAATPFFSRVFSGMLRPKRRILGSEFAGDVAAVGAAVGEFQLGDHVFGINPWRFGAHAEFVTVRARGAVAHKPAAMPYEQAAAVCDGALLALNCLTSARLRKGQTILVYGASGSIGSAGVQLAKYFDAHITAVCNTRNFELARSLGAEEVIDHTLEDFTRNCKAYDVVFDAVGKLTFDQCKGSLQPGGIYLPTDRLRNVALAMWTARVGDRKVVFRLPPKFLKQDVMLLKQLIESGRYRAVVDRVYPIEEVVAATRYVETGQKVGNVVLSVLSESTP